MDYLSGKIGASNNIVGDERKSKIAGNKSTLFSFFCKSVIGCLNPDEQASISERFLTPEIVSVMKDKDLIECINAFFDNNLNVSETSRNAFLHRNTLLYRIEKVNKVTGLNIRNFEEAMIFKLLTVVYLETKERLGHD